MFKFILVSLWRQKARFFFISFSVIIGICLMTAILVIRASLINGVDEIEETLLSQQQPDFTITPQVLPDPIDWESEKTQSPDSALTEEIQAEGLTLQSIEEIKSLNYNFEEVTGSVEIYNDRLFLQSPGDQEFITRNPFVVITTAYLEDSSFNPYVIVEGRAPVTNQEIVLDKRTVEDNQLELGDELLASGIDHNTRVELVGVAILNTLSLDGAFSDFVGFNLVNIDLARQAARLPDNNFSLIKIKLNDNENSQQIATLKRELTNLFPSAYIDSGSLTETEISDTTREIKVVFDGIAKFILFFVMLAMLVAVFVIINTYNVILAQRSKEIALLRSLALSKSQIAFLVIWEACIIGFLAALLGIVLGITLGQISLNLLYDNIPIPLLPTNKIVWAIWYFVYPIITGILVVLISALIPTIKAARKSPIASLTDTEQVTSKSLMTRSIVGLIITCLGLPGLLAGFLTRGYLGLGLAQGGFLMIFIGVIILSPVLLVGFVALKRKFSRRFARTSLTLALGNISRQPRRAAINASALIVGMTLIVSTTILIHSIKNTFISIIAHEQPAEWQIIYNPSIDNLKFNNFEEEEYLNPIPSDLLQRLEEIPEITHLTANSTYLQILTIQGLQEAPDQLDRPTSRPDNSRALPTHPELVTDIDTPSSLDVITTNSQYWEEVVNTGLDLEALTNFKQGQIAIGQAVADRFDLKAGQTITVDYLAANQQLVTQTYTIAGILDDYQYTNNLVVDQRYINLKSNNYSRLLFDSAEGFQAEEVKQIVEREIKPYANLELQGLSDILNLVNQISNYIIYSFIALLGLSLLVAMIGIFNILSLSIIERTKEIGVLRALGMSRGQVRWMIILESLLIVGFAVGLSIGLGALFTAIIIYIINGQLAAEDLADDFRFLFSVPWLNLLMYIAVAGVIALIAAIWPAIKAARLNIIKAVTRR